jgi:predicted PurR-regulated permease PerM
MAYNSIQKFFIIVLLGTVILLIRLFWTYISSIVLALLIASAFYPLYSRVKRLFKNRETTASILMSILIMLVLIMPVGGFVGTLSNEALDFYKR